VTFLASLWLLLRMIRSSHGWSRAASPAKGNDSVRDWWRMICTPGLGHFQRDRAQEQCCRLFVAMSAPEVGSEVGVKVASPNVTADRISTSNTGISSLTRLCVKGDVTGSYRTREVHHKQNKVLQSGSTHQLEELPPKPRGDCLENLTRNSS